MIWVVGNPLCGVSRRGEGGGEGLVHLEHLGSGRS
jgi:hypothetical protein